MAQAEEQQQVDRHRGMRDGERTRGTGLASKPTTTTFGEYSDEWMRARIDLAERTVELYQWLLDRHIGPTFAGMALDEIGPPDVRSWHAGAARTHPTTAAKAYRLLSSIMRTAVGDELIHRNPCQVRGAAVGKAPERPIATIAEVDALAEAMPPGLRIVVALAAWCQLRRGEVRGLRRRDVDLARGALEVSITKTTSMSGHTIIKEPKTRAGRRTVAIPPHILEPLAHHLDSHVPRSPNAFVVGGSNRTLSVAWDRARSTLGREDLRFHDLRHSGLTWSAGDGSQHRRADAESGPRLADGGIALSARHRRPGSSACTGVGPAG
jgi:integrase